MKKSPTFSLLQFQLSTDQLWPLIVLAGFCFFVSLVPLPPNDFWWHLKIGELIFKQGTVPQSNLFAWTLPADAPFHYGAWLGDYLLYAVYRLGELELVIFARNLLIGLAFWLTAFTARRHSGSWRLAALVVGLISLMTLNNLVVRPQIWAWLPFALFVLILNETAFRRLPAGWLALLPLLMAFWVNIHGSFILGGVLIGVHFVGEALQTLLKPAIERNWRLSGDFLLAGVSSGAAMLLNPRGFGIVTYVIDLLTDQPSQQLVVEWQSPTPAGIANLLFYFSILLLFVVVAYSREQPNPTEILLTLSFLWLAWSGQRYIVWYGMVVLPILARKIAKLPLAVPPMIAQRNWLNTVLVIVLFAPCLLVQPWLVERFPLSEKYWSQVLRDSTVGPLVGVETPVAAVEYLRQHPGGKIFNEMGYGSYLIWALPEQGVFVDPRVELYPYQQWQDYIHITRGARYNLLLDQYGADRLLLDRKLQPELILALTADPGWRIEYQDVYAQIWQKVR